MEGLGVNNGLCVHVPSALGPYDTPMLRFQDIEGRNQASIKHTTRTLLVPFIGDIWCLIMGT